MSDPCAICGYSPCQTPAFCAASLDDERRRNSQKFLFEENAHHHSTNGNGSEVRLALIVDDGDLPAVAAKLRDILARSGALFDRGMPVRLVRPVDGGLPVAIPLTHHGVVRVAHQHCWPQKPCWPPKNTTLPDRVAHLYLDMAGDWQLPKLVGITSSPILTSEGEIHISEGYEAASGLFCCGIPQLVLPHRPTREQALAALTILRHTFKTFPFADAARRFDRELGIDILDLQAPIGMDESGFLVGLLTAVCRQSLWLAPGLLLDAPQISGAGCGKGLLARAISTIAYGMQPRPFTPGNDKHEMDKRIVAALIEGSPILFMDNANATLLRSNTLASIITERPSSIRELGRSRMIKLEHSTFVVLTGNGLTVGEDLARRFISSSLDAQVEDPEQRPFKPGFLEQIQARRSELLAAALTIWRWGRQNAGSLRVGVTLGSFEVWGQWVRDPLLTLGCRDPAERIKEIKTRDPNRQRVAEIYEAWWEAHASEPVKASELAEEVKTAIDPQGRGRQYLARAVEDLTGTRQSGFVLTRQKGEGRKAVATYQLKKVAPQGDGLGRHPPHTPRTVAEAETSPGSTSAAGKQTGDASGIPPRTTEPSSKNAQVILTDGDAKAAAKTMLSRKTGGMAGMWGMSPDHYAVLEDSPRGETLPADDYPDLPECLRRAPHGTSLGTGAEGLPPAQAMARVTIREVWPPALGPPGDDIYDIDPRWPPHRAES